MKLFAAKMLLRGPCLLGIMTLTPFITFTNNSLFQITCMPFDILFSFLGNVTLKNEL